MPTKQAVFDVVDFKADGTKGTFTALVSVYGNVDRHGERVQPGAFDKSLARWREKGDPIPVIWSHNWADPHAYVGEIDPDNAVSTDRGLQVTGKMDLDDPFAAKVHKLLSSRRVAQWSFGYEVLDEKTAKDGAVDLLELDLIETGPTLKGANPMTDTAAVKADEVTLPLDIAETVLPPEMFTHDDDEHGHQKNGSGPVTDTSKRDGGTGANPMTDTAAVKADEPLDIAETVLPPEWFTHDDDDFAHQKGGSGPATDTSEWDGGAAMTRATTAADYRAICAGVRTTGEPDERSHYALPHHKAPGSPANAAGVRAARARFEQTEGLANREAARNHLFSVHKLPSETASVDPVAVKAEAITRLTAMRDWVTEQLVALDPALEVVDSGDVDLATRIARAADGL
jgi:HK97 family phage prohead protease